MNEVSLRDVTEEDLLVLYEHQRDPEAARMAAFPSRDRDEFFAHWKTNVLGNDTIVQAVLCGGEVAGNVLSWVNDDGRRLVGYWIGREFWGKGVATQALSRFLEQVHARPLFARVAKHNVASIRVLEKSGFQVAGEDTFTGPEGDELPEFVMVLH